MTSLLLNVLKVLRIVSVRQVKRLFVAVVGMTVLLIGIALSVLPGPAFLVIPAGLAILATEFVWARRWLQKAREFFEKVRSKKTRHKTSPDQSVGGQDKIGRC